MTDITSDLLTAIVSAPPDRRLAALKLLRGEPDGPLFCSKHEAASLLGVCRNTIYRLLEEGRITQVELLPGFPLIRRADLFALARRTS